MQTMLSKSDAAITVESGTASMKHMLDNLRPNDSAKKVQWDKKTKGFCQLFEAYLKSRSAPKIDWYSSTYLLQFVITLRN